MSEKPSSLNVIQDQPAELPPGAMAQQCVAHAADAVALGRDTESVQFLQMAAETGEVVKDFHFVAGLLLAKRGNLPQARAELKAELKNFPNNVAAATLLSGLQPPPPNYNRLEIDPNQEPPPGKIDLFLDLSNVCNYQCVFCNNPHVLKENRKTIRFEEFKEFASLVKNARIVDITGWGEVTVHPDFEKILEHLSNSGVYIRLVTNGSNLTERVTGLLAKSKIAEIIISVNSLDPETYLKIHKKPIEPVLKGIQRLHDKLTNKRLMSFSFVVNAWNFRELKNFIDMGKKYDTHVACLGLTPTMDGSYAEDFKVQPNAENMAWIEEVKEYARDLSVSFWITPLQVRTDGVLPDPATLSERIKGCRWVYTKSFISKTGDVSPCCWNKQILGNIKEQSFDEIWNGEKYNELRDMIKRGDITHCSKCGAH